MRSSKGQRGVVAVLAGAFLFAGASLFAGGSASAGTPYTIDREVDTVRGWTIAANAQRRGCFASATFQSETSIELGLDMRNDSAFMVFANASWDKIRVGETYELQLTYDGHKKWHGKSTGIRIGKLYGLALEGVKTDFVVDFARYKTVQINYNGRRLDGFNLAGTRAAVQSVISCTQDVQAGRITPADDEEQRSTPSEPQPQRDQAKEEKPAETPSKKGPSLSTGTGFFVDDVGHLMTNAHVVEDCDETQVKLPDGRTAAATILARTTQNDLAVLKVDLKPTAVAKFRSGAQIRLGDPIVLFGYPLAGELTITGNLSTGLVSAMAGPGEDVTRMQISAPVQSGNSGGAVVDQSGHVVGVVVAKANTRARGDGNTEVLQNVNFAIKAGVAGYFLDANQIPWTQEPAGTDKSTADVAAMAKDFSALVICRSR
ncbi:MAG: trypsin-like peptidase domain-containing protein [Phyllobacteriaceae bacterium]|nr:trypsin-like peptidase domain-containing protein [Phyllobacteriaceae bacterium]